MTLTEQQLAQIFKDSTQQTDASVNVADCLSAPDVSAAEAIVSDFQAAQATKLAIHMKPWSEQVGHELAKSRQNTWSQRLTQALQRWIPDSPFAVSALAVVFTLSAVVFFSQQPIQEPSGNTNMVTNDVINALPFEGDDDRLSKGGFDGSSEPDRLFQANFS